METTAPLKDLARLDPELARRADDALAAASPPVPPPTVGRVVEAILWAFSQEIHFGEAVAEGCLSLAASAPAGLDDYLAHVRRAGANGPALGRIVAVHLAAVLRSGTPSMADRFFDTIGVLRSKGTYLLEAPLEGLARLLSLPDPPAALDYLDLLRAVFSAPLSYNRCRELSVSLSRALDAMPETRRRAQIQALARLGARDADLVDAFLEGCRTGLHLLDPDGLRRFVDQALARAGEDGRAARRFLSLSSGAGRRAFEALRTAVPLDEVRHRLDRYLQARLGRPARVEALSALKGRKGRGPCTDGTTLYLPDEINRFGDRRRNESLYGCLTRLESGVVEFDTHGFDLDRALAACAEAGVPVACPPAAGRSDLEAFFAGFSRPELAADLFAVFDCGRIRRCFERHYPGLARRSFAPIAREALRDLEAAAEGDDCLQALFWTVGIGRPWPEGRAAAPAADRIRRRFDERVGETEAVEACAVLTAESYGEVAAALGDRPPRRLAMPFGRELRPDLHFDAHREAYGRVDRLRDRLRARGIDLRRIDLVRRVRQAGGRLTASDVRAALKPGSDGAVEAAMAGEEALEGLVDGETGDTVPEDPARVRWYREWDHRLGDYLDRHVRVCDRLPAAREAGFYPEVLERRRALVGRVRHAFELLKPEGLQRLRRWVDGDEFDYRELLESHMDRRAGLMPSDRIYIKRVKHRRDVAVLLLVDLSKSTSNLVGEDGRRVVDVAKEAMVLFCEALEVLGDRYAVAGFSGSGRLGVDYYRIKDFDAPLGPEAKAVLGGVSPQRSTRMGAAIRRAQEALDPMDSRARMLVVLSDGFPNDTAYKQTYAVEDTRRAIAEGRARGIFTHGITVNLPGHPRLDDLYGARGHTVLSNILELPDNLLRVYGTLTRG